MNGALIVFGGCWLYNASVKFYVRSDNKQLLDEVEHDIMNYQNWGLCYLPKPKAEADNTDTRFWYFMIQVSCENQIQ